LAGDETIGGFAVGEFGEESGIGLEFAIDLHFETLVADFLAGEGGGGGHFARGSEIGARFCGEAEHGDAGFIASHLAADCAGLDGDFGELFHGGLGDDGAIGKEHHPAFSVARVGEIEHHAGGDGGSGGEGFDELNQGAEGATGGFAGPGDEAIDEGILDHHGGEVMGITEELGGGIGAEVVVAFEFFESGDESGEFGGSGGIDDADVIDVDFFLEGDGFDLEAFSENDRGTELKLSEAGGGVEDAGFGSFGEDDAFGVSAKFFEDGFDVAHKGEKFGDKLSWGQAESA